MSTLAITFPDGRGPYTFKGARMAPPGHIHATCTQILLQTADMVLAKAETSEGPRIVKIGFSEDRADAIEREARAYDELARDLMGTDVCAIYGSYEGTDEHGQKLGCIVGEDCEMVVDEDATIPSLPMSQRREIANRLGRLHHAGLLPMFDVGGGNLGRFKDGSLRIGHFEDLRRHDPPCEWDGNWRFDESQPDPDDFKCDALYEAGVGMGLWRSLVIDYFDTIKPQTTVTEEN